MGVLVLCTGCADAPARTPTPQPAEAWGSGLRGGTPSAPAPTPPPRPTLTRPAPDLELPARALQTLPPPQLEGFTPRAPLPRRSHGPRPALEPQRGPTRPARPGVEGAGAGGAGLRRGLARVERVVDGDTVWLTGVSGTALPRSSVRVRLLHVDSPEVASAQRPGECYAREARGELQKLLPEDSVVEVVSEGEERDQYGRYLLHLSRNGRHVATELVERGAARVQGSPALRHGHALHAAQERARQQRRGMWRC